MADNLQVNFSGGEISEALTYRPDVDSFYSSLKKARNGYIKTTGGFFKRTGTRNIAASQKSILYTFQYSKGEYYVLEFSNYKVRFYTKNGLMLNAGGTAPYELISPYGEDVLEKLVFSKIGDVIYIASGGVPMTLTRYGNLDWQFMPYKNKGGPFNSVSFKGAYSFVTDTAVTPNITTVYLSSSDYKFTEQDSGRVFGLKTSINSQVISGQASDATTASSFKNTVIFCSGAFGLKTTGTWSGKLKIEVSEDKQVWSVYKILSSVDGNANYDYTGTLEGTPRFMRVNCDEITEYGTYIDLTTDMADIWIYASVVSIVTENKAVVNLQDYSFEIINYLNQSAALTPYTLPVLTSDTSDPDVTIKTNGTLTDGWKAMDGNSTTYATLAVDGLNGGRIIQFYFNYKVQATGLTIHYNMPQTANPYATRKIKDALLILVNGTWQHLGHFHDWLYNNNAFSYDGYASFGGTKEIEGIAFTMECENINSSCYIKSFDLENAFKRTTVTAGESDLYVPLWTNNSQPSGVKSYQDRLFWFNKDYYSWTQTGKYDDFSTSLPLVKSDGGSSRLVDETLEDIQSSIVNDGLIVFTTSSAFKNTGAFSATDNYILSKKSNIGGTTTSPACFFDRVIYPSGLGNEVRDFVYNFDTESYGGIPLTIRTNDIFEKLTVKRLGVRRGVDNFLFALMSDGTFRILNYIPNENIRGWTYCDTLGTVEDFAIATNDENKDVVYFLVKRKIGGVDKYFVEVLEENTEDVVSQFFVDCGIKVTSETKFNSVSYPELANATGLVALCDGGVVKNLSANSEGLISLGVECNTAIVGFPFTYKMQTLPLNLREGFKALKGVIKASIIFLKSRGGLVGQENCEKYEFIQNRQSNLGSYLPLQSGVYSLTINRVFRELVSIEVIHSDPLPCNISGIDIEFGGN